MKRLLVVVALALLAAVLVSPAAPEAAAAHHRPAAVRIIADVELPSPFDGSFNVFGPAVSQAGVCTSGDIDGVLTDAPLPPFDLKVTHTFICDDGSGTFDLDLWVWLFPSGNTLFFWAVSGGTGDHGDLSGAGVGVGRPIVLNESIRDFYWGWMQG